MKILMTADTIGKVWPYTMELCRSLSGFDIEVVLATMGRALSGNQWSQVGALDNISLYESRYCLEWMRSPWRDIEYAGNWLLEITEQTCPDIIHLNHYAYGDLPWRQPVMIVGHSCAYSWWVAVHNRMPPANWNYYRQRVSRALHQVDYIVAPTETMLHALEYFYGIPGYGARGFSAIAEVIPNGRSITDYATAKKSPAIFSEGCLWDEAINIKALAGVAKKLPWPVIVAGDSSLPEQRIDCPGLNTMKYLGSLTPEAVVNQFASASIYASPAKYEPSGLSILEAALSGCALVLGDIPSMREVWGNSAVYIEPDDPDNLHAALMRLIEIPKLRFWYAERARQHAQRYMVERMAAAYDSAYATMLKRQPRRTLKVS